MTPFFFKVSLTLLNVISNYRHLGNTENIFRRPHGEIKKYIEYKIKFRVCCPSRHPDLRCRIYYSFFLLLISSSLSLWFLLLHSIAFILNSHLLCHSSVYFTFRIPPKQSLNDSVLFSLSVASLLVRILQDKLDYRHLSLWVGTLSQEPTSDTVSWGQSESHSLWKGLRLPYTEEDYRLRRVLFSSEPFG